jgi:hypothetical protein
MLRRVGELRPSPCSTHGRRSIHVIGRNAATPKRVDCPANGRGRGMPGPQCAPSRSVDRPLGESGTLRLPRIATRLVVRMLPIVALAVVTLAAWYLHDSAPQRRMTTLGTATHAAPIEDQSSPVPPVPSGPAGNPHGDIHIDCETCHTAESWKEVRRPTAFDHSSTGFPLVGKHATTACMECHGSKIFSHVATSCTDCHRDVHEGRKGTRCQDCHSPDGWTDRSTSRFLHASSGFPLRGAHALAECATCHRGVGESATTQISRACVSCHAAQYAAARAPDHAATGITTECQNCHDVASLTWNGARFDHASTGFQLEGAHRVLECAGCHSGAKPSAPAKDCIGCHRTEFASAHDPEHGGFSTQCTQCHSMMNWAGASFDHTTTGFSLTGAHSTASCIACHADGRFKGTPSDCVSCHQAKYDATSNPSHTAAGFSTTCTTCHSTSGWSPTTFDHGTTGFVLSGAHRTASCVQCHQGEQYAGTATDCFTCHQPDYASATDPNHAALGFPTDCTRCHSTSGWPGASFDHTSTGFALTGAHTTTSCTACHTGGTYAGTPTDCASCHQADFAGTSNPSHTAAGFSTTCTTCHSTSGWSSTTFDHGTTGFVLSGAHRTASCVQCHQGEQYAGTSSDCFACHQPDYASTTNPDHAALGFPTLCTRCHSTSTWSGASFDHAMTGFVLTRAHATVSCNVCHADGRFAGTPTDCATCHQADFAGTSNPNHTAAGFSPTCTTCHSTSSWASATFDHGTTGFSLTGAHNTASCVQCHQGEQYAGTTSECYACHQANYASTTNPNHAALGFSTVCTTCHTTTAWAGATFDHATTGFALAGAHATTSCTACHTGGTYAGTPTDCDACHHADFTGTTNPNHTAAGFPTTCTTCHGPVAWTPSSFDHTAWFRIYSGAHRGRWSSCTQCHTNPNSFQEFDCLQCHGQSSTDSHHQEVRGYSYQSTACYSCHRGV